jgi:ABC-type polysaccharide/polyol phosphate export permease
MSFSSLKIIFNDLENIWLYFTRLLWFLTPIFYTVENNEKLKILTLFNPLYYFIEVARKLIIYSEIPSLGILEGMILFALVSLMIGLLTFKKLNTKFPERVR